MALIDKLIAETLRYIGTATVAIFDRSFSTKSFNGRQWKKRQVDMRGTLMNNTGTLRRSLKWKVTGRRIEFVSNLPYAKIHNEGGKIRVTRKMQKYFWAKYKELTGKVKKKRNGDPTKATQGVARAANYYKALALKKVGTYITIPKRQFIGRSAEVEKVVQDLLDAYIITPLKAALERRMRGK